MPESRPRFRRMALIGVGLVGGSLALALRAAGCVDEIIGVTRPGGSLDSALGLGVIDRALSDPCDAVRHADLVVLATPAGAMPELLRRIAGALDDEVCITDVASVKARVAEAGQGLGALRRRFCPGHPIAGAETAGVAAARADLFQGRPVVLTPDLDTDAGVIARITALWRATGAEVHTLDAGQHDDILALTSHLPHLAAFAATTLFAAGEVFDPALRSFVGTGFCDFSRIAASDPIMWRDICLQNPRALVAVLARYRAELRILEERVLTGDGAALEAFFAKARKLRLEAPCGPTRPNPREQQSP